MYPTPNPPETHAGQVSLNFCPNCGSRLAPVGGDGAPPGTPVRRKPPNFCAHCGYQLTPSPPPGSFALPPAYGLDTLIEATLIARTTLDPSRGSEDAEQRMNVTLMGVSRTLMGASRSEIDPQGLSRTLMGAPRSDINPWGAYAPDAVRIQRDREDDYDFEFNPHFLLPSHRSGSREVTRVPLSTGLFLVLAALIGLVVAIFLIVNR